MSLYNESSQMTECSDKIGRPQRASDMAYVLFAYSAYTKTTESLYTYNTF